MRTRRSSARRRPARGSPVRAEKLLRVRTRRAARPVAAALRGLPPLQGKPISLVVRRALWTRRGRLLSQPPGVEVHAASFLRRRRIYLEQSLFGDLRELHRILIHEIFHFVWLRLGNHLRRQWEALLGAELRRRVRGELGHSSQRRKQALTPEAVRSRSRRWREYVCESFCDSAAWWFLRRASHPEFTLAVRWRKRRGRWLARLMARAWLPV